MANAAQSTDQLDDQPQTVEYDNLCQHWHESMMVLIEAVTVFEADPASAPDKSDGLRMIEDHVRAFYSTEGASATPPNTTAPHVAALVRGELEKSADLSFHGPESFVAITLDTMEKVDNSHIVKGDPIEE